MSGFPVLTFSRTSSGSRSTYVENCQVVFKGGVGVILDLPPCGDFFRVRETGGQFRGVAALFSTVRYASVILLGFNGSASSVVAENVGSVSVTVDVVRPHDVRRLCPPVTGCPHREHFATVAIVDVPFCFFFSLTKSFNLSRLRTVCGTVCGRSGMAAFGAAVQVLVAGKVFVTSPGL